MKNRCQAKIYDKWAWGQCSRDAKVEHGGKWYCEAHDSIRIKEKREEQTIRREEDKEFKEKQDRKEVMEEYFKGVSTEEIKKLIANGWRG